MEVDEIEDSTMEGGPTENADAADKALMEEKKECVARSYQTELLTKSLECNTIVCLKTGAGKTLIAILLIKEMQHQIMGEYTPDGKVKRTFFLVPKVPLVHQQALAVRQHTFLSVGAYCGSVGVDLWHPEDWEREMRDHQVIVMTAQILVNMLQHGYMKLEKINLIIFDECHIATGNSPYCAIMDRFKDCANPPKVLGLTASIINGKCKPSRVELVMRELESVMLSRIETAANPASVHLHATKPKEMIVSCGPNASSGPEAEGLRNSIFDRINDALEVIKPMMKLLEKSKETDLFGNYGKGNGGRANFADLIRTMHTWADEDDFQLSDGNDFGNSPHGMLKNVVTVMIDLGLYCAKILVDFFLADLPKLVKDARDNGNDNEELMYDVVSATLKDVNRLISDHLSRMGPRRAILEATTPRLTRLMELLISVIRRCDVEPLPDDCAGDAAAVGGVPVAAGRLGVFRAIVFVQRRVVAWILDEYLKRIPAVLFGVYSRLRSCYMVGHGANVMFMRRSTMTHQAQTKSLEEFRSGKCNVMVATKVVEEGLDIPKCNLVVRFDAPKEFCSYVQSMGRARAEVALFVMLVDQDELNTLTEDVTMYKMIENTLNLKSHGRQLPSNREIEEHRAKFHQLEPYYPGAKDGACLTQQFAVQLLYWYCCKLPSDAFSAPRPSFKYVEDADKNVRCIMRLPVNSMYHSLIEGDLMNDRKLAKSAAAYRACIILHQKSELNDNLMPCVDYLNNYMIELGVVPNEELDTAGAALSNPGTRKRRRIYPRAIADELGNTAPRPGCVSYLYAISFEAQVEGEVSQGERCCYGLLSSKELPTVAPFTVYEKRRLIVRIRRVGAPAVVLSEEQLVELEIFHRTLFADVLYIASAVMTYVGDEADVGFLLAPLDERTYDPDLLGGIDSIGIDWLVVSRFVRYENEEGGSVLGVNRERNRKILRLGDVVENATSNRYGDFAPGVVVAPLHRSGICRTGRFVVLEVKHDLTPNSPFPSATYKSYGDYFKFKYDAVITDWNQPLILVDFAPNAMNLLLPSLPQSVVNLERRAQLLIPELCSVLPLDVEMYRHSLAIPSVLHRLNGMLNARGLLARVLSEASLDTQVAPYVDPLPALEDAVVACPVTHEVSFGKRALRQPEAAHMSSLFFQALTTRSASNWDSLERLEVIGDSFLKFIVSSHLFCRFPNLHEGALSLLRTGLVKNHNLYHHGGARKLPSLFNVQQFSPRTMWIPPGYRVNTLLTDALMAAAVPCHFWAHAKVDDVTEYRSDSKAWLDCLEARWNNVDPAHRDNQTAVIDQDSPTGSSGVAQKMESSDGEDEDDDDDYKYNQFVEHLIGDKTVADSVEALIGAMLVSCGQKAAVKFMVWLGLKIGDRGNLVWRPPTDALLPGVKPKPDRLQELYKPLAHLEEQLGYVFREKSFLRQAVIHSSYTREAITDNYQRLEFLGDAVLDFLVTMHLYQKFPDLSPGDLTDLRSSLADNVTFAYLAIKSEFHKDLQMCSQELFQAIDRYLSASSNMTHPKDTLYMKKEEESVELEEIEVPKALGDLLESIAGAVYLDSGMDLEVVWNVFYPIMRSTIDLYTKELPINPIRVLLENFPLAKFKLPVKSDRSYEVKVTVNGKTYRGYGKKQKIARHAAAKCALRGLNILSSRSM